MNVIEPFRANVKALFESLEWNGGDDFEKREGFGEKKRGIYMEINLEDLFLFIKQNPPVWWN